MLIEAAISQKRINLRPVRNNRKRTFYTKPNDKNLGDQPINPKDVFWPFLQRAFRWRVGLRNLQGSALQSRQLNLDSHCVSHSQHSANCVQFSPVNHCQGSSYWIPADSNELPESFGGRVRSEASWVENRLKTKRKIRKVISIRDSPKFLSISSEW